MVENNVCQFPALSFALAVARYSFVSHTGWGSAHEVASADKVAVDQQTEAVQVLGEAV